MDINYYKYCIVPKCISSSIKTPRKLFIYVPNDKEIRRKWLQLARRDTNVSSFSRMYFCEDHFDLPNDMENYMEYHVMGSVSQVRMKPGCIPKKFLCQDDSSKRTSTTTKRPSIVKKQRKILIDQPAEHDVLTPVLNQKTDCQDAQTDPRATTVGSSETFENLAENEGIVVKEENVDVFETQIHKKTEIDDDQTENMKETKHVPAFNEHFLQIREEQNVLEVTNKPKINVCKKNQEAKVKRKITCSAKVFENALATGVTTIIERVYNFFKKEFDYLSKTYGDMLDLTPFCKYKERTAEATGFHINVIERVLKEGGQEREKTRPQKRRRKEKKKERNDDSDTETCDEAICSSEESGTRSVQPVDQGDRSYTIPFNEATTPKAIVKIEPLDDLPEPEVYVPTAGTSLAYKRPTKSEQRIPVMNDNEQHLNKVTHRVMAAKRDPLKIETDSFVRPENAADGSYIVKEERCDEGYS